MKKFLSLLLAVMLIFSLLGCNLRQGSESAKSEKTSSTTVKKEKAEDTDKEFVKPEGDTKTKQDYIKEIDDEYQEMQYADEYGTTEGMSRLAQRYAEKWEEVSDEYFKKLTAVDGRVTYKGKEYSSKEFREYITDLKNKRLKEIEQKKEENLKELNEEYEGGSIIGPAASSYNYDLQMEWALELVEIYSEIG